MWLYPLHTLTARKIRLALVPQKPKEFVITQSNRYGLAWSGTRLRVRSSSSLWMFVTGGKSWSLKAKTVSPGFDETAGSLGVIGENGSVSAACPLRHTEVRGAISGFLARVTVTPLPPVLWGETLSTISTSGGARLRQGMVCVIRRHSHGSTIANLFSGVFWSTSNHTNMTVVTVSLTSITEPQNSSWRRRMVGTVLTSCKAETI
jgi:hypothetical protein